MRIAECYLRRFNQLHLAILLAVKHLYLALWVAKNEDFAVAEFSFFDGLFQSQRLEGHRVRAFCHMGLGVSDRVGKRMHSEWDDSSVGVAGDNSRLSFLPGRRVF